MPEKAEGAQIANASSLLDRIEPNAKAHWGPSCIPAIIINCQLPCLSFLGTGIYYEDYFSKRLFLLYFIKDSKKICRHFTARPVCNLTSKGAPIAD